MSYTSEQAKRLTIDLLETSVQAVQEKEVAIGGGHVFTFMQQPIEFTDTLTLGSPTLYGLVLVVVSTKKEDVTGLAEAIEGMQVRE